VKILITGGNTFVPIDKVRGITNIFKGNTAVAIANEALRQGHHVTLLGNKEMGRIRHVPGIIKPPGGVSERDNPESKLVFETYRTYDDLYDAMQRLITEGSFDTVVHSAAVSDYKVNRVLEPAMLDLSPSSVPMGGKISSSYDRLYLEMPT
jgi:phosphopantothenoylcysteine synthetase/decarboxylase